MDKRCATCGKQLQADQAFCDNCGAAWAPAAEAAPAVISNPINPVPQPVVQVAAPAKASGSGKALLVTIIVLVALGIGGWLFLRSRSAAGSSVVSSGTTVRTASAAVSTQPVAAALTDTTKTTTDTQAAVAATTQASANSKPCSVVTSAEMEKILGMKIVKLTTNELICSYFTSETMSAQVETTWTGGKDAYAQVKGFNSAPGLAEPVQGIGDEAYLQAAGVMHILKGDTYVVINSREYPNERETETAIAEKVMEKMK
jgi:hypothetical protein